MGEHHSIPNRQGRVPVRSGKGGGEWYLSQKGERQIDGGERSDVAKLTVLGEFARGRGDLKS